MNPLAPTAADNNHSDTAGFFLSVPSNCTPAAARLFARPGFFFDGVTHGEEQ